MRGRIQAIGVVPGALLGTLLAAGALPTMPASVGTPEKPPNVLIIVTDDQRAGTLSVMPQTRRVFAGGGTLFANAFVSTPLCCPSRASIFTGRYAHNHQVRINEEKELMDPASTLQRYLQEAGYRTAIVGKYLNAWSVDPPRFDRWAIFQTEAYFDARFNVNGQLRTVARYSTDYLAARARMLVRRFDQEDDARPWMLLVAPIAPHAPYIPEPDYARARVGLWDGNPAAFEEDLSDKPPYVRELPPTRGPAQVLRRWQLRTLLSVDDLVGGLFRTLERLGEDGDTLAFFVSDNGLLWGEHGLKRKAVPYPQATRVPLLVRWPGRLPPGAVDRRPVANVDIAPTVLEASGLEPDPDRPMDGRSLLAAGTRDHLFMEYWRQPGNVIPTWASVRTTGYQYVEYYDDASGAVVFREYYDLAADPWQLENLLGDDDPGNDPPADVQASLATLVEQDRQCVGRTGPAPCP